MAFWDNIGQKASETTVKAVQKAREISDIAKLNSMISEEETKINNTYYQIGKLYIATHSHDPEEEFAGMIASFAEAEEKIKNYRQQIQNIKGVLLCPQCGAEVQIGAAFCSSCSALLPNVPLVNAADLMQCKGCGAMIKKGVRFCTSCGKPVAEILMPEATTEAEDDMEENNFCPQCGAKIEHGIAFCTECGTKL